MGLYLRGLITELCKIDKNHKMRFAGITISKIGIGVIYRVKKKRCENLAHLCKWHPESCKDCSGELFEQVAKMPKER